MLRVRHIWQARWRCGWRLEKRVGSVHKKKGGRHWRVGDSRGKPAPSPLFAASISHKPPRRQSTYRRIQSLAVWGKFPFCHGGFACPDPSPIGSRSHTPRWLDAGVRDGGRKYPGTVGHRSSPYCTEQQSVEHGPWVRIAASHRQRAADGSPTFQPVFTRSQGTMIFSRMANRASSTRSCMSSFRIRLTLCLSAVL